MGRKAKLKQQRRAAKAQSNGQPPETGSDTNEANDSAAPDAKSDDRDFVKTFEQWGHRVIGGDRSPDIPESRSR